MSRLYCEFMMGYSQMMDVPSGTEMMTISPTSITFFTWLHFMIRCLFHNHEQFKA